MQGTVDTQGNIDEAWDRHERIMELRGLAEQSFLALGEELYEMRESEAYKRLDYDTFTAYIADPGGVNMKRSSVYSLVGNYERYVLELGCPTVGLLAAGWGKLDTLRPYVDKENIEEWLNEAGALSRSDLQQRMKEAGMRPRHPKPDANQAQIMSELRDAGIRCYDISTLPDAKCPGDLLVRAKGRWWVFEIKDEGGRVSQSQEEMSEIIPIVHSTEQIFKWLEMIEYRRDKW